MTIKQFTYGLGTTDTIQHDTEIIEDKFNYVTEIGIYGLPGTEFLVNGNGTIILNGSGLLTIGRDDYPITSLICTNLNTLYTNNNDHCLVIDVIGEGK